MNHSHRRRAESARLVFTLLYALVAAGFTHGQDSASVDESKWFRNIRPLTRADMGIERAGEAYFSPDGKRVCFQAYPKGETEYQIYVINIDGTGLELVSTGKGATTCSFFHPDNKRILFASNHLDPRPVAMPGEAASQPASGQSGSGRNYNWSFFPGMDIFEYDFASKKLKQLTTAPGYDAEGSYSPDGKRIVFTSMRDNDQEIYIMNADGSAARRITNNKGYDGGPFFSPDGKSIVYRSDRKGDGNLQIFVNNLDGTDERALTGNEALHWCPFWHPSGKWLVYTYADHGGKTRPNYDLHLLSVDGKQDVRITSDPAFDGLPVFSPDGKLLMWTTKRGGLEGSQVVIAEFTGLTPSGELAK